MKIKPVYNTLYSFGAANKKQRKRNILKRLDALSPKKTIEKIYPKNTPNIKKQKPKSNLNKKTIKQSINKRLLDFLFTTSGNNKSKIYRYDAYQNLINKLSHLGYFNIQNKYLYYINEITKHWNPSPLYFKNTLLAENITKDDVETIYHMAEYTRGTTDSLESAYYIEHAVEFINKYDNFNELKTSEQYDFINNFSDYFDYGFLSSLEKDNGLFRFKLIKDLETFGGTSALKEKLIENNQNKPVTLIEVDNENIENFSEIFSYQNMYNAISDTNLKKYKTGFPLKYPRKEFIKDFKSEIKNLTPEKKREVYKYFQFEINDYNFMTAYPMPNNSDISKYPKDIQSAILKNKDNVNRFIFGNKVQLDKEDENLENFLNEFIKVFPEFISTIGKIQHRGDSIDFHTLEVLQFCLNNPESKDLTKLEQEILFLSVMFHDIAKKETLLDKGHQRESAYYAKEILKKLPFTLEEKERIYNLIFYSHWTTDNTPDEDLATIFRYKNDFKIAEILAKADTKSAGLNYDVKSSRIENINSFINKINKNGIMLFADNLPYDKSKFLKNEDGIIYLDFSDDNKDLSEYGFKSGTKVKDLNFICHNSQNTISELKNLCDDSKDICLSVEFRNAAKKGIKTNYHTKNNGNTHVIIHSTNQNIALGGTLTCCTGNKRGFREYKEYLLPEFISGDENENKKQICKEYREELPNYIKQQLKTDDDEYAELYSILSSKNNKEEIEDITLSTGRIITKEDIKQAVFNLQNYLLNNKGHGLYLNEEVIFRPKLEAIVMDKEEFLNTPFEKSQIKITAKEENIPVILV